MLRTDMSEAAYRGLRRQRELMRDALGDIVQYATSGRRPRRGDTMAPIRFARAVMLRAREGLHQAETEEIERALMDRSPAVDQVALDRAHRTELALQVMRSTLRDLSMLTQPIAYAPPQQETQWSDAFVATIARQARVAVVQAREVEENGSTALLSGSIETGLPSTGDSGPATVMK